MTSSPTRRRRRLQARVSPAAGQGAEAGPSGVIKIRLSEGLPEGLAHSASRWKEGRVGEGRWGFFPVN